MNQSWNGEIAASAGFGGNSLQMLTDDSCCRRCREIAAVIRKFEVWI